MSKWNNAGISRVFANWAAAVQDAKAERVLLARFTARWKQMGLFKTFQTWKESWKEAQWAKKVRRV